MNNCFYLFIFLGLYVIFFTNSELYSNKVMSKKNNMVKI
jgi:hypothetical protein